MDFLYNLFFGSGTGHSILIFSIVITLGILLGKIKIAGISLGITWILFVGIAFSHFGMSADDNMLHFMKEFGLILFVYSIGMQVGPSFFASFKKSGMTLNLLAILIVFLGIITTYIIHLMTELPITTMVGILSGAVTNTPGLGAAQDAFFDMTKGSDPTIAMGYAVAYPLGVLGIIFTIILIRYLFRIKLDNEIQVISAKNGESETEATKISLEIINPAIFNKRIMDITKLIDRRFVISRVWHGGNQIEVASSDTCLKEGDKILVIVESHDIPAVEAFIGRRIEVEWDDVDHMLTSRKIMITKSDVNGKTLKQLRLRSGFGVNVTRVSRAGVDLVALPNLELQIGDRLTVVGSDLAIKSIEKVFGNSMRSLREPNLIPIFLGIFLGIILGSIPIVFPGIPQPVKLGLAGGPLIVAILLSRFGPKYKLITYSTVSANLMLRELGISLFLASVGLGAGEGFVETIVYGGGYKWIGYGVIITIVPIVIVGIIARLFCKIDYFSIMGLIAGSTTDPPALAYSNSTAGNDLPAVSYATVYPLTMFLRVLTAQLLILFLI